MEPMWATMTNEGGDLQLLAQYLYGGNMEFLGVRSPNAGSQHGVLESQARPRAQACRSLTWKPHDWKTQSDLERPIARRFAQRQRSRGRVQLQWSHACPTPVLCSRSLSVSPSE
jgi:hypothetical protein